MHHSTLKSPLLPIPCSIRDSQIPSTFVCHVNSPYLHSRLWLHLIDYLIPHISSTTAADLCISSVSRLGYPVQP